MSLEETRLPSLRDKLRESAKIQEAEEKLVNMEVSDEEKKVVIKKTKNK